MTSTGRRIRSPAVPLWLGVACVAGAGVACGPERGPAPAMVHLVGEADEGSLAKQLSEVTLVLDAPAGFSGSLQSGSTERGYEAADVDGDGELEISLTLDVEGRQSLPRIRVDPGSNKQIPIGIRAVGLDGEQQVVAYGGTAPQPLFINGKMNRVYLPLKLSRPLQPVRPIAVAPRSAPRGPALAAVGVYFSKPVDPDTLRSSLHVYFHGADSAESSAEEGTEQAVEGSFNGPFSCGLGTELWLFEPVRCLSRKAPGGYVRVVVGTGLTDEQGAAAEQLPATVTQSGRVSFDAAGDGEAVYFGPCDEAVACDGKPSRGWPAGRDIFCNAETGSYEPALCSIDARTCETSGDVFAPDPDMSEARCLAARPDAELADGECVATARFVCKRDTDCDTLGTKCNVSTGLCLQNTCTYACKDETLACSREGRCVPRLGVCAEDCRAYHACPDLSRVCVTTGRHAGRCD